MMSGARRGVSATASLAFRALRSFVEASRRVSLISWAVGSSESVSSGDASESLSDPDLAVSRDVNVLYGLLVNANSA